MSTNVSVVLQPSLFSLDSGRELRQERQLHFLPSDMRLNDKLIRLKYAKAGLYINGKLARAHLLAANENYEAVLPKWCAWIFTMFEECDQQNLVRRVYRAVLRGDHYPTISEAAGGSLMT
ncbi:hypothetical protein BIW11_03789 [Tropilaelaps mercedesae]|uniref:Uncharacterized protein n=1 Tax=Tropilaelaps mercedesae TaxID=418985 RepID=A0A1V9XFY1_9ACAR|nr:hypothetical protein BIW11_03789 [Tropilaelaps mercedesae]